MEAANRWETEAIRESRDRRSARPTVSQQRKAPSPVGDWRTLREVSDETGIPIGTLRKWCRRESVDSYLESDGEQTLRMLEMGSVERNARAMGRELVSSSSQGATGDRRQAEESHQTPDTSPQPEEGRQATGDRRQAEAGRQPTADSQQLEEGRQADEGRQTPDPSPQLELEVEPVLNTQYSVRSTADEAGQNSVPSTADEVGQTMIVPIDAWNKMLNQLGNLHEAGQQLAEARERAGKAETEAKFLRERLAEMRESRRQATGDRGQAEESRQDGESYQPPAASYEQELGERQQATGDGRQAEGSGQPTANSPQPESGSVLSTEYSVPSTADEVGQGVPTEATIDPTPVPPAGGRGDAEERSDDAGGRGSPQWPVASDQPETTSFWRYVVRGWRGRKR